MMSEIEDIKIRKILDSRGNPTVEVEIFTLDGGYGRSAAPSGASTGKHEVCAYPAKGLDFAIEQFRKKHIPKLLGMEVTAQEEFDAMLHELDATDNFSNMGGNVAAATSLAVAFAAASEYGMPLYRYLGGAFARTLPLPFGNVLNGGKHAVGSTDIQEYLVVAQGETFRDSVFANAMVHKKVKEKISKKYPDVALGKGDECGWVAKLGNIEALEIVVEACQEVRDTLKIEVHPALDLAASEFYEKGKYHYKEQTLSPEGQIDFVAKLVEKYGLYSLEDPLDEEDFEGYVKLTERIGDKCLIIGDDIFVTNYDRIEKGIRMGAANAVLIKVNQIGTLTDALDAVSLAHDNGYSTVISHRSGETTDAAIAHLSVAFGCLGIKTGVVGGERIAKLNELIRIEEELYGV
ncbi:MAG: phosphopyruvate hydratase [Thermoplasmata archaeon]|nr:phosphopyruvate hydratase [Thermoplasmata archaeon]